VDKYILDLAKFRLTQAHECLELAKMALEADFFKSCLNRSYYCIFHCMRAVLALENFDAKRHSGIIAAFRQRYIKTGKFDIRFSDIIGAAFEIRNSSDYEDFYVVNKSDTKQQLENAKMFYEAVQKFLNI
jgi:uncharacterized protein (UPF0332 family)